MDRPVYSHKHLPGPERPLLSIRLTRSARLAGTPCYRQAQTLLDLALGDVATTDAPVESDGGTEFAGFLNATLPATGEFPGASGRVYQHYEVLLSPGGEPWVLGRGAMGVTYKARDLNLHCEVALKVINPSHLSDPTARARFLREARAAARLRHPHIASIFHLGFRGDDAFYAMEYIAGETLADHIKRFGPLPPETALEVAAQVTLALGAAHRKGFLHRDIKPANLMLTAGEDNSPKKLLVKVIDFGLVKGITESEITAENLLAGGYFVGTPPYASPEQLAHRSLDARTDLYSLGVTLCFLLTGETPRVGTPMLDTAWALPLPVVRLLRKLLHDEVAARPPDAAEASRLIEHCRAELAPTPGYPPQAEEGKSPGVIRRHRLGRWLAYPALAVLVSVALSGARMALPEVPKVEVVAVLPLADQAADAAWTELMTADPATCSWPASWGRSRESRTRNFPTGPAGVTS